MATLVNAQAPEKINYQAVARDLSGNPIVNTTVNLTFEILEGTANGNLVFAENQTKQTNEYGLFTAEIGGVNTTDFPNILWGSNAYYLRITINGDIINAGQLLSVPYALYSRESANGPQGATGATGAAGINGINGVDGVDGIDGAPGINGTNGIDGVDGAPGVNGTDGNDGVDGINGAAGINGTNGNDGIGVDSIQHNADGTLTIFYSNATSFITGDLTGAPGVNGASFFAGNGITISADTINAIDASITNEIQALSINGDTVFLSNGGGSIVLPVSPGADGWGIDVVNTSGGNLSGDGTIGNPLILTVGDPSVTNEIQTLAFNSSDSNIIEITNGNGIPLSSNTPSLNQVLTWNGANWVAQNPGSGADNWGSQLVNVDNITITGDGDGTPLSAVGQDLSNNGNSIDISGGSSSATISAVPPSTGEYLYWNGINWVSQPIAPGFDGQYSSLTGAPTNHLTTVNTDGFSLSGDGTLASPLSAVSQDLWITGNSLFISLGGTSTSISTNAPTLNQVLTWNGGSWVAQNAGAGADNWGSQLVNVDGVTIMGDGDGTPLTGFDGQYSSLTGVPTNVSYFANDAGYITTVVTDGFSVFGDGSAGDPLNIVGQDLSNNGNNIDISGGGSSAVISAINPTVGGQILTWSGTQWEAQAPVSGFDGQYSSLTGAPTNLSSFTNDAGYLTAFTEVDGSTTNETITSATLGGTTLTINEAGTPHSVDLSGLISNDGDWTISSNDMFSAVSGNVGIGISPVHKLDVSGGINTNTAYHIDGVTFLDNKSTSTLVGATGNTGLTGIYNTFVGDGAGQNTTSALRNTFVGRYAGRNNATGYDNTLIGAQTVNLASTAGNNTALGSYAGTATTAGDNTFIGAYSGGTNTSGTGNTFIGHDADATASNLTNTTAIGSGARVGVSNAMVLGANNTNVGIGTSNPNFKLHVVGGLIVVDDGSNPYSLPLADGNPGEFLQTNGVGTTSWQPVPTAKWGGTGVTTLATASDNVGIGTTNPTRKLQVNDNSTNPAVFVQQTGTGSALTVYSNTSTSTQTVFSASSLGGGVTGFNIKGDGSVGIGTTNPSLQLEIEKTEMEAPTTGSVGEGFIRLSGSGTPMVFDMGIADDSYSGAWLQVHRGSDMSIHNNLLLNPNGGNVGIGINNPTSQLHIKGGHLRHEGTQPVGTGNGTVAGSTDMRGAVNVNFAPTGSITVTFSEAFTLVPTVIITPVCNGDPSVNARFWINNVTTTGFTVNWSNTNSTPSINYMVIE